MGDVIVIGGGIVGASAAYRLARGDATVTLADRMDEGQATAAGAGIIAPDSSVRPRAAIYQLAAKSVEYYPRPVAHLEEDGELQIPSAPLAA